jgi:RND family efflux transporter MFP subunit
MRHSFILLALVSCSPSGSQARDEKPRAPLRGLVTANATDVMESPSLSFLGVVRAAEDASLGATTPGRVDKVLVQIGDRVTRGAELLRLRDVEARAAAGSAVAVVAQARARLGGVADIEQTPDVRAARAALDIARDARTRLEALVSKGSVSEQDMARAKATEQTAESQLDAARAAARVSVAAVDQARAGAAQVGIALSDLTLRAPFDGVVVERFVRAGETVAAGAPLVRIVDDSSYRLEFDVPPQEIAQVVQGARVWIDGAYAADGGISWGTVARMGAALQTDSRLRRVEATMPPGAPATLAGSRVKVRVETGPAMAHPEIPCDALRSSAGIDRVWVLKASVVEERLVVVLRRKEGERCVLAKGVKTDELVVRNPPAFIQDGDQVQP